MKTKNLPTFDVRTLLSIAGAMLLLFASFTPSSGQGDGDGPPRATSRDGLAQFGFMTTADVSDDLEGNNDEYFYKFKAGPGKLTIIFEVTANETNAGAMLDLFGTGSKAILSNVLAQGVDGGSERVSKSITLSKKQEIVIRIKAISYGSSGSYPGIYKLRLEGPAVNFNEVIPTEVIPPPGVPTGAPIDTADPGKPPEVIPPADVAPETTPTEPIPAVAGQGKKPDKVDRAIEKGQTKAKKVLDLLDKVKAKKP